MNFIDLTLSKVSHSTTLKPLDCGNSTLNDFLFEDSKNYLKELYATTYILEDNGDTTIAYFSIFNDSINVEDILKNKSDSQRKKIIRFFAPHGKRHLKAYPAIKIGRLAVGKGNKTKGIGSDIIRYVIYLALEINSKCACKYITVDALAESEGFYKKLNFEYLSNQDEGEESRQMYLDLKPILNMQEELQSEIKE